MALTDDARAEIAEAVRIVREDRFEAHARGVFAKLTPAEKKEEEKKKDELLADDDDKVTPPPKKEGDEKVVTEEKPKRHSRYWGEILDD